MTNAELIQKIRAEIERQIALLPTVGYSTQIAGDYIPVQNTLNYLLSFLSTLESEIPKDLEQASKEYCPDDAYPFASDIINKEVRKAFIAGWKAKEESEKPVPADLEEAAKEYALDTAEDSEQYSARYLGYKDGAKWQKEQNDKELSEKIAAAYQLGIAHQKEQMLKDAVEGKIAERVQGKLYARCQVPKTMGVEFGDKVRIIIVKEDGK